MKAEDLVNSVDAWLPGARITSELFGLARIANLVVIGEKILANPDQREDIIAWLKWTRLFTGQPGDSQAEPSMPTAFADCQEAAIDVREAVQEESPND